MDEEARIAYYAKEMRGAPLVSLLAFRCTYQLEVWLKTRGAIEGREYSSVSFNVDANTMQRMVVGQPGSMFELKYPANDIVVTVR